MSGCLGFCGIGVCVCLCFVIDFVLIVCVFVCLCLMVFGRTGMNKIPKLVIETSITIISARNSSGKVAQSWLTEQSHAHVMMPLSLLEHVPSK